MKKWYNWIYQPIAYLHLKSIQRRYRAISLANAHNQTNMITAKLKRLQSQEAYYRCCFDAWGIFHPSCVVTERHKRVMVALFPVKDFPEHCGVKWYSEEAVGHYRNCLFAHRIKMPRWNDSFDGPGTYNFSKFIWFNVDKNQ